MYFTINKDFLHALNPKTPFLGIGLYVRILSAPYKNLKTRNFKFSILNLHYIEVLLEDVTHSFSLCTRHLNIEWIIFKFLYRAILYDYFKLLAFLKCNKRHFILKKKIN